MNHPMRIHRLRILCLILACLPILSLGPPAGAQAEDIVRVVTQLANNRMYVGETIALEVRVQNADQASTPDPPVVDGLEMEFLGTTRSSSTRTALINGRRRMVATNELVMRYSVTALRRGEFSIPAMTIRVGNDEFQTTPQRLLAETPPRDDRFSLLAELERDSVYVGEPVRLTVTWVMGAQAYAPTIMFDSSGSFRDEDGPATVNGRAIEIRVNGRTLSAYQGRSIIDGQAMTTLSFARVIIPERPGRIEIGPMSASFDVVTRQGRGFMGRDRTERRVVRSEPVALDVRPLPQDGRPANFSGLVGRFDINAAADPTRVYVGDPIELRAIVRGPEPLDRVAPPDLDELPAFGSLFKLSPEGWDLAQRSDGARVYTTTIRAATESVNQIPAIELPHFDSERGEYRTASSRPIPVTVLATQRITAEDAISAGAGAAPINRLALDPGPGGVRGNFMGTEALADERGWARTLSPGSAIGLTALLIPPIGCAFTVGSMLIRRSRDPLHARRQRALRRAETALSRGGDSDTDRAARAVCIYLADRFGRDDQTITSHDAVSLIGAGRAELGREAGAIIRAAERPGDLGHEPPPDLARVRALLRDLDRGGPS